MLQTRSYRHRTPARILRVGMQCVAAIVLLAPAYATDNYAYKPNEYVVVRNGKSPDGHFSIAAHGGGELGYDNFHIYLMAEPGHRKIGPLEEIKNNLDTGAQAFIANWSKDSHYVAITYRIDRHIGDLKVYRIANRRAYPIVITSLFNSAFPKGSIPKKAIANQRSADAEVTWLRPGAFRLYEHRYYYPSTPEGVKAFGKYGKPDKTTDGGTVTYGVDFAVEATCELTGNDHYRIVSLRPASAKDR